MISLRTFFFFLSSWWFLPFGKSDDYCIFPCAIRRRITFSSIHFCTGHIFAHKRFAHGSWENSFSVRTRSRFLGNKIAANWLLWGVEGRYMNAFSNWTKSMNLLHCSQIILGLFRRVALLSCVCFAQKKSLLSAAWWSIQYDYILSKRCNQFDRAATTTTTKTETK